MKTLLLAAGFGSRLMPLTSDWPKCLMPISGRPLLEYWLETLHKNNLPDVLVNLHYKHQVVIEFLERACFKDWVRSVYEPNLLGTAGTIKKNYKDIKGSRLLLIHADNWCQCAFDEFLLFHDSRPKETLITMMTFATETPSDCGIVELDCYGVVQAFHEKVKNPPNNIANAAVYILEPSVVDWIYAQPCISDFSTEVLPKFVGRIATWKNSGLHRDIGTIEALKRAQDDAAPRQLWADDDWACSFRSSDIVNKLAELTSN